MAAHQSSSSSLLAILHSDRVRRLKEGEEVGRVVGHPNRTYVADGSGDHGHVAAEAGHHLNAREGSRVRVTQGKDSK